MLAVKRSKFV